jgi:hypothetical protein
MTRGGLPHSDIPGSKLVCSSPGLFAACHVLHRLLAPRHSPYTLSSLTIKLRTDAHQSFACQLVCDSSFSKTLRVFVVGKNYRVQNIQLSKIRLAGLCRQSGNVGHRRSATCAALNDRCRRRCRRGPKASSPHRNFFRLRPSGFGETGANVRCRFKDLSVQACLAEARFRLASSDQTPAERRLVENTGLEPVTSWLQTRRSPS